MASLRKKDRSPYWFACFTLPEGTRTQRSTKVPYAGLHPEDVRPVQDLLSELFAGKVTIKPEDTTSGLDARAAKRLARRIADKFEDAAIAGRTGQLIESQARKTIADIYALASADSMAKSTTGDFFKSWLKVKGLEAGENTVDKYTSVVTQFIGHIGSKARRDISNLTAGDITGFRDAMAERLSVGTVNVALKIIRSALNQAKCDGLVDVNEAERVKTLKHRSEKFERRPFTLGELKRIIEAADDEWRGMILFGLYTGQRLGDIASLTWQNVDLQRKELKLETQKTSRRQIIPLHDATITYLEGLPTSDKPDAPLFPKAHATMERLGRASQLSNQFYELLSGVGLAKKKTHQATPGEEKGRSGKRTMSAVSFHSLRHTATTLLKAAGVSDAVAREFVGHDSASISQNYTHIETATLKAAADRLPDVTR